MPLMSIDNYEGTSDLFTFPYNPKVHEVEMTNNFKATEIPFDKKHIFVSGGGISPSMIVLSGHTSGTNRFTDFRNLSKHVGESTKLKKLYFESDKFSIVLGKSCKQVNDGERVMFIDYVASFQKPLPLLFGDTQKTSGTNGGNASSYVEEISFTITTGALATTVSDGTNSWTIPAGTAANGSTVVMKLITMVVAGNGIYMTEYRSVTINGTRNKNIKTASGSGIITLAPGANITSVTTSNASSVVKKFRDAWYM